MKVKSVQDLSEPHWSRTLTAAGQQDNSIEILLRSAAAFTSISSLEKALHASKGAHLPLPRAITPALQVWAYCLYLEREGSHQAQRFFQMDTPRSRRWLWLFQTLPHPRALRASPSSPF